MAKSRSQVSEPTQATLSAWISPLLALGLSLTPLNLGLAAPITKVAAAPVFRQGSQILLNGRPYAAAWAQWQDSLNSTQPTTGISDGGLMNRIGFELFNTNDPNQQPVQWFSNTAVPLRTRFTPSGDYRYLDITELAQQANWQMQANGGVLEIVSPAARMQALRLGQQPWGERIVIGLDQPTPWQLSRLTNSRYAITDREFVLTLDATADPSLAKNLHFPSSRGLKTLKVSTTRNQTTIQAAIAGHVHPEISMLANPSRLVIDIRSEPTNSRDILWAPGLRWREQVLSLGPQRYPVIWLAINPRQPGLKLQPIWGDPNRLVGINTVAAIAQNRQAAAAINGGYFNRDNQTPLGAIRQNGNWISSPILNRGAIGWDDNGGFKVGRLSLQETLTTSGGQSLPVVALDSGFPQKGIARYTRAWGTTYTSLLKNETIIAVQNHQVMGQSQVGSATSFSIPANGYLLVLRDFNPGSTLSPGTILQSQITATPNDFNQFPQILGAGPLLLENSRIVLNARAEQFRPPFDTQGADRSAIGQTADGTILIAAVHNRVGGPGPTLAEWAQLMQQLGAVDALNLDGGSSTTLYLGGQLLDRHPTTAARVHNSIGVFIQAPP